ncbi:hypothetical protein RUND412_008128 [Rhizina undulata]
MSFYQHDNLSWTLAPLPSNPSEKKLLSEVVKSVFAVVRPPNHNGAPGYPLVSPQDEINLRESRIGRLLPTEAQLESWREPVVRFNLGTDDPLDNRTPVEKTGRAAGEA